MLRNIVFDFDGVIANTFDLNWALSREHDGEAALEDFLAHHDGNVFAEPRIKFKPEHVHLFYSEYANRLSPNHLALAAEPLRRLAKDHALFIVSSNSESAIKEALQKSDLLGLFIRVMGKETHESKVEKFTILNTDHAVTPENALFITDTLGDIKEAHKVNIRTIAETFGFHNRERLMIGKPFRIADSWEEIEEIVSSLRN